MKSPLLAYYDCLKIPQSRVMSLEKERSILLTDKTNCPHLDSAFISGDTFVNYL